jgi:hypothetical protein
MMGGVERVETVKMGSMEGIRASSVTGNFPNSELEVPRTASAHVM